MAARRRSIERLRAELQRDIPALGPSLGYDVARARMAARGYERALFSYARRVEAPGAEALRIATERADHKIVTAAITESSEAFSHERDRAARKLVEERRIVVWKVWDASLDRRVCPVCERMHGRAVPAHEDFEEGRPGGVHPRCRCVELLLTSDQIDFGRND